MCGAGGATLGKYFFWGGVFFVSGLARFLQMSHKSGHFCELDFMVLLIIQIFVAQ